MQEGVYVTIVLWFGFRFDEIQEFVTWDFVGELDCLST